jgi:hypothetical protein
VNPGDRIAGIFDALDRLSPGARRALIVVSPLLLLAALVAAFAIAPHGRGGGASPPHLSTTDHPLAQHTIIPPSRPAPTTASTEPGLSDATGPALRFLRGYLAYAYGRGPLWAIRDADPRLIASLRRAHPRVPPAARKRRPRVTTLQVLPQARSAAQATATISDGSGPQYPLIFYLDRRPGGWIVTRLGDD